MDSEIDPVVERPIESVVIPVVEYNEAESRPLLHVRAKRKAEEAASNAPKKRGRPALSTEEKAKRAEARIQRASTRSKAGRPRKAGPALSLD